MLEEPTTYELQELISKQELQIEESRQKIDRIEDTLRSLICKFGEMIIERCAKDDKPNIIIHTNSTSIGGSK